MGTEKALGLPFSWMGTKVKMRGVLLPIIDSIPRALYVEPFGGAGGLFFGKKPERAEVFNDSNELIINAFRTLRNSATREQVLMLLDATPMSRSDYYELEPIMRKYFVGEDYQLEKERARLGVYCGRSEPYESAPYYQKPYIKGWRIDRHSWASVRDLTWSGNMRNWGEGSSDWSRGAAPGSTYQQKTEFSFETQENIRRYFNLADPFKSYPNEFHFPRPEIYLRGVTKGSLGHALRELVIREIVPQLKIGQSQAPGDERFPTLLFDDFLSREESRRGRKFSNTYFRNAYNGFRIAMEFDAETGWYYRIPSVRYFLDVVDQIKIRILENINALPSEFNMTDVWNYFQCDEPNEKMLYDAAIAELMYEGFFRTHNVLDTERGVYLDYYALVWTKEQVNLNLLYLHKLNSTKFATIRTQRYAMYQGQDVWKAWAPTFDCLCEGSSE